MGEQRNHRPASPSSLMEWGASGSPAKVPEEDLNVSPERTVSPRDSNNKPPRTPGQRKMKKQLDKPGSSVHSSYGWEHPEGLGGLPPKPLSRGGADGASRQGLRQHEDRPT